MPRCYRTILIRCIHRKPVLNHRQKRDRREMGEKGEIQEIGRREIEEKQKRNR